MKAVRAMALVAVAALGPALLAGCSSGPNTSVGSTSAPAVTAMSPSSGTTQGGTSVTINGIGFTKVSRVAFGSVPADSFKVVSNTEITAVSPPESAGDVDLAITTPKGINRKVKAARYAFVTPAPSVTGVSPSSGSIQGGTLVTITGMFLTGATKVAFGKVAAASFKVLSDTQIAAVTPAESGAHAVVVTTRWGTSSKTTPFQFIFKLIPVVTSVSPSAGTTLGGTTITIIGSGFSRASRVTFGGVAAPTFNVVSDTEIKAVTPALGDGPRYVYVNTPGGNNLPVAGTDQFTFQAPVPVVTGVSPTSGPIAGGTLVTITGTGFERAGKVTFGSIASVSFTVVSDTQITALAPPQGLGARFVYVSTPGGRSAPVANVNEYLYH